MWSKIIIYAITSDLCQDVASALDFFLSLSLCHCLYVSVSRSVLQSVSGSPLPPTLYTVFCSVLLSCSLSTHTHQHAPTHCLLSGWK